MENLPRISILTSTFNSVSTLQRCIDSISAQTYANLEHIIIDNCSEDGTVELLKRNEGSSRLSWWLSEPDKGIYNAWNKALPHCAGEWILFLGSDDQLADKEAIEKVVAELIKLPEEVRVAYGKAAICRGYEDEGRVLGQPWDKAKVALTKGIMIPHVATFHHRSLFELHGNFDDSFRLAGDMEFLCRELLQHDAKFIDVLVTRHYHGGVTTIPRNRVVGKQEVLRISRQYNIGVPWERSMFKNCWYWISCAVRNILKIDISRRLV